MLELSVPVNVKVFDAVNVLPSAIVNVADVAGAVIVTLLIVVAEAAPKVGVVNDGDVAKANTVPEPVVEYDVPQAEPFEFAMPDAG